jgi:hypothetical protein
MSNSVSYLQFSLHAQAAQAGFLPVSPPQHAPSDLLNTLGSILFGSRSLGRSSGSTETLLYLRLLPFAQPAPSGRQLL